jgi:hypothetical protein
MLCFEFCNKLLPNYFSPCKIYNRSLSVCVCVCVCVCVYVCMCRIRIEIALRFIFRTGFLSVIWKARVIVMSA